MEFKNLFGSNKATEPKLPTNESMAEETTSAINAVIASNIASTATTTVSTDDGEDTTTIVATATETNQETTNMAEDTNNTITSADSETLKGIAAAGANYTKRTMKFNFRKDVLGVKRPSVEVDVPVLTLSGLVSIIEQGGKQLDLVLSTLEDVIYGQARQQVDDAENYKELNTNVLTWEAIANLPKAERKGGGIAKEQWEAFCKDYLEVMPKATGKTLEQVGNAAKILMGKFQSVKTSKKIVSHLADQLGIWLNSSANAEEFLDCYEFLSGKAESLLQADEAALLENL
jgi:hypothetical protein